MGEAKNSKTKLVFNSGVVEPLLWLAANAQRWMPTSCARRWTQSIGGAPMRAPSTTTAHSWCRRLPSKTVPAATACRSDPLIWCA
jgi:hypothetical protein